MIPKNPQANNLYGIMNKLINKKLFLRFLCMLDILGSSEIRKVQDRVLTLNPTIYKLHTRNTNSGWAKHNPM